MKTLPCCLAALLNAAIPAPSPGQTTATGRLSPPSSAPVAVGSSTLLPAPSSAAAAAATDLPALRVTAGQVTERRPSEGAPGSTTLTISIASEGLTVGTVLRRIAITKAQDNRGRLIPLTSASSAGLRTSGSGTTGSMLASVVFGSIGRDATSLNLVEGTIELYLPSETEGSLVRIDDLTNHPGPVENASLSKLGISLQVYGNRAGYDRIIAATGIAASPLPEFPRAAGFFIRDPGRLLLGWALQDSTGRTITSLGTDQRSDGKSGTLYNLIHGTVPLTGMRLLLWLSVPESIKLVPYRLDDIPLP